MLFEDTLVVRMGGKELAFGVVSFFIGMVVGFSFMALKSSS